MSEETGSNQKPMMDEKYLVLRQCFFDAKQILEDVNYPKIISDHTSNDMDAKIRMNKQNTIAEMAFNLYTDRIADPLTVDKLKQLTLSGYDSVAELEELKDIQESIVTLSDEYDEKLAEYNKIQLKITELTQQIDKLELQIKQDRYKRMMRERDQKAYDFLANTISHHHMITFVDKGYIDILGTNKAIYRLERKGKITKFVQKDDTWKPEWGGVIRDRKNLPMDDCLATLYAHIMNDSNKFDKDKACGNIYIR